MKPLLGKEIRLLLPAYSLAFLLAVIPIWLLPNDTDSAGSLALYAVSFGVLMLALSSFGREFGMMTFPLLMAQPVARSRIWWTKVTVLTSALGTILIAWYLSSAVCIYSGYGRAVWLDVLPLGTAATVVLFAGGLWTTLLLRQVTAAFWFTILVPGTIVMVLSITGARALLGYAALGLYSAAGIWWARRQFLHAQETAWTGGVIAFPGRRMAGDTRISNRRYRPWVALFKKELQLHQVGLAGMGGLFLLHLGVVVLRKAGGQTFSDAVRSGLQVFAGIWLIVPVLVSAASVAEERKLGTMQPHLCLPISARKQFAIKLLFVLLIGGLLSTVLLVTAEWISSAIGAGSDLLLRDSNDQPVRILLVTLLFLVLSMLGFYASTMARHLVQALALAVLATIGMSLFFGFVSHPENFDYLFWRGNLGHYIAWPTLLIVFLWLAWRNFRSSAENWDIWRRNGLGILGALLFVTCVTSGIYNRVWELIIPLEPPHGPGRLASSKPPILKSYFGPTLTVLLPDGRLWVDRIVYDPGRNILAFGSQSGFQLSGGWRSLSGNRIIPGTNWVDAVANSAETVGIQSDGTLWVSEKTRHPIPWNYIGTAEKAAKLVKFGADTNWQSVTRDWLAESRSVILLKQDGTLWRWNWNSNTVIAKDKRWFGLRAVEPHRLGTESNWARILAGPAGMTGFYAWQRDGRAWMFHPPARVPGSPPRSEEVEIEPDTVMERLAVFDNSKWRSASLCLGCEVDVREDGTLWAWSRTPWSSKAWSGDRATSSAPVIEQIGMDTDWEAVASDFRRLIGLKKDGSLWQFHILDTYSPNRPREVFSQLNRPPIRLGRHHDWMAIGNHMNGVVSLSTDGSLWNWWDRSPYSEGDQPMLAPSRRPAKIENILELESNH